MTTGKPVPCSDQSLARGDTMYGTASAGFSWMLLELPGGWGRSAFLQSPSVIDPQLGRAIVRRVESAKMRIAAIRKHGRREATPRWRWFVAHSSVGAEALYAGEVDDPRGYLDLALDGSDGELSTDPVVAICAHGKHDQCCAVRGRSACTAIAAQYPEITWECSHLGGDRFAATMLVLPEGLCYGRVDSADSAELVRLYLEGRLDNRFLRGRTSLPHAVQAAQHFAREAFGDDRIDALHPTTVDHGDGQIRVVLDAEAGAIEVVLAEQLSDPLQSQCHAQVLGRVRTFTLVSITST
ncbi:sucrase ferredoxin [Mycobacterium sp. 1274761.0]|uniref:sucrase ferredoxin n=1 Tax=Mycobacterium sp. 1274761.0 TaxID=1834077 RepID=UPI0008001C80|nr:sucrase ferredoxin [Mycobacterium sp. 1274761.0]OBK76763.1 sucrase ferredoxin [Mycobacterium sp. 1274761.0]